MTNEEKEVFLILRGWKRMELDTIFHNDRWYKIGSFKVPTYIYEFEQAYETEIEESTLT